MATVHRGTAFTTQVDFPGGWTMADLQERLGGVSAERIRLFPPPACATEEDVIEIQAHEDRLYELDDGILVEKGMGWYKSIVAALLVTRINNFLATSDLGKVLGADGPLKILPGMVKIPDVTFISWNRWPKTPPPRRPVPAIVPDLAVEILSETNTKREMDGKLANYFRAGVRLVWYVDPATRSATVYRGEDDFSEVESHGVIVGGDVLPDFCMSLRELFDEADRQGPRDKG
jgi:Uma2 family endonuclease